MYQSDAEVERDVQALRRRLMEEPVERQVVIRKHSTVNDRSRRTSVWWVVSVPTNQPGNTNRVWFYLERSKGSDGGVHVKDSRINMRVIATLPTVEAAYFAGAIAIERPS